MHNALDLHGRYRRTLQRRQQHPPQCVTNGNTKTTLERANGHNRLTLVIFGNFDFHFVWLFQIQPILFNHGDVLLIKVCGTWLLSQPAAKNSAKKAVKRGAAYGDDSHYAGSVSHRGLMSH